MLLKGEMIDIFQLLEFKIKSLNSRTYENSKQKLNSFSFQ